MLAQPAGHRHSNAGMPDQPHSPAPTAGEPICATVAGTRLELIDSGEGRLVALLEAIRSAQGSIRLLFYIFNNDETGARVRDALVEAASRGVRVKMLLDGFGCANVQPTFFAGLAAAGGQFCLFNPKYGRRYLVRNHQKLVVVDDRVAIIGGANVHNDYVVDAGICHWRDLWLRIEGDAVPSAGAYFDSLYRWTTNPGGKLKTLRRLVLRHSDHRGPLQWKFSGPLGQKNAWRASFSKDLRWARRVEIISAYFSPPRSILRRIGRAARHAEVRIVTAGKSDNNATIGAARHNYARMLRRSVRMFEYQAARLHSKLVIIDDAVHIGSVNFDIRSFYINLEIMLRIEDPAFAAAVRVYFEREIADSEEITEALHNKRATLWRRFRWTLSHWLVSTMDYTVTRRLNFGPER